jgi:hypothetical protein
VTIRYGVFDTQWHRVVLTQWRATLRAYNRSPAHVHDARPDDRRHEDTAFTFIALRDHFR